MAYDVIIIGAGPAGMFAAHRLATKSRLKVAIIEKGLDVEKRKCIVHEGKNCAKCSPCRIMSGVGGSGGLSDGKLNLDPKIGGDLTEFTRTEEQAWELIDHVDSVLMEFGAPKKILFEKAKAEKLSQMASMYGVHYIPVQQKHVGSDKLVKVIGLFKKFLEKKGVDFKLSTEVVDLIVDGNTVKGVKVCEKGVVKDYPAKYVILAPGREGEGFFVDIAKKHKIELTYSPLDIGVRVETSNEVMRDITSINWDPKFHVFTKTHDDFVRTFCTNPRGFVVKEMYDDHIGVNGHAMISKKSNNTNFALLVRIKLTEPLEDTYLYGKTIAQVATVLGGGKPIVQRLGDLRRGRRSTWERIDKSFVKPTLRDVTPGDISMALPGRIVANILEALEKLDNLVKGVNADSTLLYAPEIKYYSMRARVADNMESDIRNLFLAGDGPGLTRDIINAAATGVLAADGLIERAGQK